MQLEDIRKCYFGPFLSWSQTDLEAQVIQGQVWILEGLDSILAYVSDREVGDDVEILSLAVNVNFKKRGFMTKLLNELYFDQNKAACQGSVFLEVHERNHEAIALYERLRFSPIARRPNYYSDGGAALVFERKCNLGLKN